jgi:hypothetical protein
MALTIRAVTEIVRGFGGDVVSFSWADGGTRPEAVADIINRRIVGLAGA